jgi:hypothetical protein
MVKSYANLLTEEELSYLSTAPEVVAAKASIDAKGSGSVYFSVDIPASIRQKLATAFGIDLAGSIPMRWIKGDTQPHVDVGSSAFDTTYLMYMNDSTGTLIVDGEEYPITRGSAYSFQEGLHHETVNTGNSARLLIGPMSERGVAVGGAPPSIPALLIYYEKESDWANMQLGIATCLTSYTVGCVDEGSIGSITRWRIIPYPASTGVSDDTKVYQNGEILSNVRIDPNILAVYHLYPASGSDTCCADSTQMVGLSYDFRNDITSGNIIAQAPPTQFKSYSDYYRLMMAKSTRK